MKITDYERDGYRIQKEHCGEICYKYSKCSTGGAEWAIFVFRVARLQSKAVQTATMHFSG